MAGLIGADWSFESGQGAWQLNATALVLEAAGLGAVAYDGTWVGAVFESGGPLSQAGRLTYDLTVEAGKGYSVALAFQRLGGIASAFATVRITGDVLGGSIEQEYQVAGLPNSAWGLWPGDLSFIANGTSVSIVLTHRPSAAAWLYDAIDVQEVPGAQVAVILGELGRKAILLTLQNNLSAELAHIVNERGDSLALAAPSSWYGFPRQAETPDDVELAVYRSPDGISFPSWEEQFMGGMTGSRAGEIHSEVGLTVTVTHANRDNVIPSKMEDRSDRYAAAILRVFRDNKTLGIAGDSSVFVVPDRVAISEVDVSKTSPNISKVDRIEISVRVVMTEGSNGETNVGGGVPPAAATETV